MGCVTIFIFSLLIFMERSIAQDSRSIMMSEMQGWQLQCTNTSCLPFLTLTALNVRNCQMFCLAEIQCEAASFDQSVAQCELFANIISQTGNMAAQTGITTWIVVPGTRIPEGEY